MRPEPAAFSPGDSVRMRPSAVKHGPCYTSIVTETPLLDGRALLAGNTAPDLAPVADIAAGQDGAFYLWNQPSKGYARKHVSR